VINVPRAITISVAETDAYCYRRPQSDHNKDKLKIFFVASKARRSWRENLLSVLFGREHSLSVLSGREHISWCCAGGRTR
jgi:hypothetical protein